MLRSLARKLSVVSLLLFIAGPSSATLIIDEDFRRVSSYGPGGANLVDHEGIGGTFDESVWLAGHDTLVSPYGVGGYMWAGYHEEEGEAGGEFYHYEYDGLSQLYVSFHVTESTPFELFGDVSDDYAEFELTLSGGGIDFSHLWYAGDLAVATSFGLTGTFEPGNTYVLDLSIGGANFVSASTSFALDVVPEPGTGLLCGIGLALLGVRSTTTRRRQSQVPRRATP